MKKIILAILIAASFTCSGINGYSQESSIRLAPSFMVALKNSDGLVKYTSSLKQKATEAKKIALNCNQYLNLIRILQDLLRHAPASRKPAILRSISKAKADYRTCMESN